MSTTSQLSSSSPNRRSVLAISAAIGVASMLPFSLAAKAEASSIRPFQFKASDKVLADLRRPHSSKGDMT